MLDVDEKSGKAKVDFGDGVPREVLLGISAEGLSKGSLVMVHAGVIISALNEEGVLETYTMLKQLAEEAMGDVTGLISYYEKLLSVVKSIENRLSPRLGE